MEGEDTDKLRSKLSSGPSTGNEEGTGVQKSS